MKYSYNPLIVRISHSDPGCYSRQVMDGISIKIQDYLREEEGVRPEKILVVFSDDYVSKKNYEVVIDDNDEEKLELVSKARVLVTLNVPTQILRMPAIFKKQLSKIFSGKGEVILTGAGDLVSF